MSNSDSIPLPTHPRFKNLTGQVFNRLSVVAYDGKGPRGQAWLCQCSCGVEISVSASALLRGQLSCGCYASERIAKANATHGMSGHPEYIAWDAMWRRCTNPKDPAYPRYRDRQPDPKFRDFTVFLQEVGMRPTDSHSLDRADNDKGYVPGNLRWAVLEVQNNNKRTNVQVVNMKTGVTMTLAQACREAGLLYSTVHSNFRRRGKSLEDVTGGLYAAV